MSDEQVPTPALVEGAVRLHFDLPVWQYAALVRIARARRTDAAVLVAQLVGYAVARAATPPPEKRPRRRRFTDRDLVEMIRMSRAGQSDEAIAHHFGVTAPTIRGHLRLLIPAERGRARAKVGGAVDDRLERKVQG